MIDWMYGHIYFRRRINQSKKYYLNQHDEKNIMLKESIRANELTPSKHLYDRMVVITNIMVNVCILLPTNIMLKRSKWFIISGIKWGVQFLGQKKCNSASKLKRNTIESVTVAKYWSKKNVLRFLRETFKFKTLIKYQW